MWSLSPVHLVQCTALRHTLFEMIGTVPAHGLLSFWEGEVATSAKLPTWESALIWCLTRGSGKVIQQSCMFGWMPILFWAGAPPLSTGKPISVVLRRLSLRACIVLLYSVKLFLGCEL